MLRSMISNLGWDKDLIVSDRIWKRGKRWKLHRQSAGFEKDPGEWVIRYGKDALPNLYAWVRKFMGIMSYSWTQRLLLGTY